ncbi:hypothetical protein [Mucilaginibacter koreensis]
MKIFNSKILLVAVIVLMAFMSCHNAPDKFSQSIDKEIVMQVLVPPLPADSTAYTTLQIRLTPSADVLSAMPAKVKQQLLYRADSCFYLEDKNLHVYPADVQAVANGINGTFEYLVAFRNKDLLQSRTLIFHDQHINDKVYKVSVDNL